MLISLQRQITLIRHSKPIPSLIPFTLNLIDGVERLTYTSHQHPVFGLMNEVVRAYQPEATEESGLCSYIT